MSELIKHLQQSVIGANQHFKTSFGVKPLIYADYTASGRGLTLIEDYIRFHVLPWYANTHTETSFTGAQTTSLREEARDIIRQAVNASEQDKVIFCGSGATTAINKLIDILNLRIPADLNNKYDLCSAIQPDSRPVVFIGPYEHHSNELPWRESLAEVVSIPFDTSGQIDCEALTQALQKYANRPLKIGSFSAASNVTGICSDVEKMTAILKEHGALSFWDYAAAGPYVAINMNGNTAIDAVFLSPHKFVGGPGTPGVLIAKQHILKNKVPAVVGGGTVLYVTPDGHRFIADHERREEGGTPAIVESIRAGLVFKLQQEVGINTIHQRENEFIKRALEVFNDIPNIQVLGGTTAERLSIFSLRFKHLGQDLHYGFVTALLNDLFGIQVRGGCSCAGPYGHLLLEMGKEYSQKIEHEIQNGAMVLRPGWVRLNFNYFISEEEFDYILSAIKLVAQYGWRLMPYYELDTSTAVWRFQGRKNKLVSSLNAFNFLNQPHYSRENAVPDYDNLLSVAEQVLTKSHKDLESYSLALSPGVEELRWFVLPQDCLSGIQVQ